MNESRQPLALGGPGQPGIRSGFRNEKLQNANITGCCLAGPGAPKQLIMMEGMRGNSRMIDTVRHSVWVCVCVCLRLDGRCKVR